MTRLCDLWRAFPDLFAGEPERAVVIVFGASERHDK